ncbi:hypothetical protein INT43_000786 [Umbelopsis isabellina]|uniref:Uncharacterized protein n=1 Tax=Mortierella isabellina TaxID=91625 RepID=A0A8H7Q3Z0_MORIS|nr:hypothetical protein INT43_000786 [Umbelopsis isabellina]
MDCSRLYPSPTIFESYPNSLYYSTYSHTAPHYGIDYNTYNEPCLPIFGFPSYSVPEPLTPVFSEPSVVSAVTITEVPSRKRKRANQSLQGMLNHLHVTEFFYQNLMTDTNFPFVPKDSPKDQKKTHPTAPQKANSAAKSATTINEITVLENDLGYLQDSWASIHIVLDSLKNAFLVTPFEGANEQQLDELDRELGIAYDDLMIQVRQLDRALKQLDGKISKLQVSQPACS